MIARENPLAAVPAVEVLGERASPELARLVRATSLDLAELDDWRRAADRMDVPFDPKLSDGWERLRFRLRVRGNSLEGELRPEEAHDRLISGEELELVHERESIRSSADEPSRTLPVRSLDSEGDTHR